VNECKFARAPVVAALLGLTALWNAAAPGTAAAARQDDRVYTIANYPVDATAESAIAAKEKAVAQGRRHAFRSLLKRLVPVTEYARLEEFKALDPRPYIASVKIRSEDRPTTRYVANLDFAFLPDRVRDLLRQRAVPFVDEQAPQTVLVAVYLPPGKDSGRPTAQMSLKSGGALWSSVWRDLDLANALAPLKLGSPSPDLSGAAIEAIARGDLSALSTIGNTYGTGRIVLAIAQPEPANRRVSVVLAGHDAVGPFHLHRAYKIFDGDFAYTLELAAVVGQGIIEGRWKVREARAAPGAGINLSAPLEPVQVWVTYQGLQQWQSIQQVLRETPGVTDLRIGGQTARSASLALRFPGGGQALSSTLAAQGLTLEFVNGAWVLR
jgi:Uncharacterized protein conserved in bacteria (DUF2066)